MSWPFSPRWSGCWRTDRFAEISVDDLAKGAGISRPTFYFYFPSKDAVLLTLFERVIAEADATFEGRAEDYAVEPARAWRDGIYAFFEPLRAHVGVALAGVAATATNAEIRALWSTYMQKWIDRTAAVITAERARGAAPDTVPAQDLAAALNLMNERTMFASYTAQKPVHCRRSCARHSGARLDHQRLRRIPLTRRTSMRTYVRVRGGFQFGGSAADHPAR